MASLLLTIAMLCPTQLKASERHLVASKVVNGSTYTLYREEADRNDIHRNYDGWEAYRIKITLDITTGGSTKSFFVGDVYSDLSQDSQLPCMLFDRDAQMMYVFCLSKGDRVDYGMDGSVYVSSMQNVNFQKEIVFEDVNIGWWPSFVGLVDGCPQLAHFSFAGYYSMISTRSAEGQWTTRYTEQIHPDDFAELWKGRDLMLVIPVEEGVWRKTIIIKTLDGATMEYLIDKDTKVKIVGRNLTITTEGMELSYELESMSQIRYGKMLIPDAIHDMTMPNERPFVWNNNNLYFSGLRDNTPINIYTIDGKLVRSERFSGEARVSLDNLPAGVYIVKMNSETYKILKK